MSASSSGTRPRLADFYRDVLGLRVVPTDTAALGAPPAGWQRGTEALVTSAEQPLHASV